VIELKIDPEFRDKIPPLTDAEFEQLRENILADGEVYEPIAVWNDVIVDGHNRWRIVQENPQIPFRTKEMEFADKWAAFEWMYRKQLGRRNLSDEQKTYLLGKLYEARKKTQGTNNQFVQAKNENRQNDAFQPKGKTSIIIAKEQGVGQKTVERAEHFAKGLDAIAEVSKEAADKILKGGTRVAKSDVSEMREATNEEVKEFADAINRGELPKKRDGKWATRETRDRYAKIRDIAEQMGTEQRGTTFDDVLRLLEAAENDFISKVERMIESEKNNITADDRWPDALEGYFDSVISDINELKERIMK
jgi:hypothetical protein